MKRRKKVNYIIHRGVLVHKMHLVFYQQGNLESIFYAHDFVFNFLFQFT